MLRLRNVKKSFAEPGGGRLPVLDVEEFQVGAAEHVVLLGRSGCGKTTLLHVIAGISTPDSGSIEVDGRDLVRLDEAERDRFRAETIGYVFQSFNLLAGFNALENVLLGMAFGQGRRDVARARLLLDRVGLTHRQRHKPAQLSGGQRQRVTIARALVNDPAIIWADEPTGDLDSHTADEIMSLMQQLNREQHQTFVIVTHDPGIAERCHRIVHMRDGLIESEEVPAGAAGAGAVRG